MKIAIDAMGADNGPEVIVRGALESLNNSGTQIILVGNSKEIYKHLTNEDTDNIEVVHTDSEIAMDETISHLRRKKDSSLNITASLVKDHSADAMVSVGNTAATLAIAKWQFGCISGINRPAIASLLPGPNGPTILLDAGAVVDCSATNILQFALMGNAYAKTLSGKPSPRIGLLSIGAEKSKGSKLTHEAFEKLKQSGLNFVGHIEGSDFFQDKADVIVTDGFSGNIALKAMEGLGEYIWVSVKKRMGRKILNRIPLAWLRSDFRKLKNELDYSEYGGAPLLGLNRICIIGHGRSNARAVASAIKAAKEAVKHNMVEAIEESLFNCPIK